MSSPYPINSSLPSKGSPKTYYPPKKKIKLAHEIETISKLPMQAHANAYNPAPSSPKKAFTIEKSVDESLDLFPNDEVTDTQTQTPYSLKSQSSSLTQKESPLEKPSVVRKLNLTLNSERYEIVDTFGLREEYQSGWELVAGNDSPREARIIGNFLWVREVDGKIPKKITDNHQALELTKFLLSTTEVYKFQARLYRNQGELRKAIDALDLLLGIDPQNRLALKEKGDIYFEQKNWKNALEAYKTGFKLYSQDRYFSEKIEECELSYNHFMFRNFQPEQPNS